MTSDEKDDTAVGSEDKGAVLGFRLGIPNVAE
jgi:hypothetical protein